MAWNRRLTWTCCALLLAALGASARADAPSEAELAQSDEIAELRRQLGVITDEVARLRTEFAVPEEDVPLESVWGLGPAASRVYGIGRGLSIGGYAEALFRNEVSSTDGDLDSVYDALRLVLYAGYKFSDRWVFNTEIEFEHAGTGGGGSASVEFAALDYLFRPEANFRAGLVLIPMGFLNEIHEPPFFLGTERPLPERQIIPTTWRENGLGAYGEFGEGRLAYRVYVVNGLEASGFSSSGLRGGRQKGSRARANDLALVTRLDWQPLQGLLVGGSYYAGDSSQDEDYTQADDTVVALPNALTQIWEVHTEYRRGALWARGLWTQSTVAEAGELSLALEKPFDEPIGSRMTGGYAEVAYDLMQVFSPGSEAELMPFFRIEYLDTQNQIPSGFVRDRSLPRRVLIPGLQYKPLPNLVLKLDYRQGDNWDGTSLDLFNFGFGLVF